MLNSGFIFFVSVLISLATYANTRTIIDLQAGKQDYILDLQDGDAFGFARLVNLNPDQNIWYILDVTVPGAEQASYYHLENRDPRSNQITLDKKFPNGLLIHGQKGTFKCALWDQEDSELTKASEQKNSYVPICGERLYVRNKTEGKETTKEFVADFLRKHVWGGEKITGLVKDYLYKDKFLLTSEESSGQGGAAPLQKPRTSEPLAAQIGKDYIGSTLNAKDLGITLAKADPAELAVGSWYKTKGRKEVFISVIQAKMAPKEIIESFPSRTKKMDDTEASAMVYLIAFDLKNLTVGYTLGTKHPSLEWSDRAPESARVKDLPGPDGLENYDPLVMTGKLSPEVIPKVIATFTGGFKRTHGAFKWGELSKINMASHYGFMVSGIIFSRLNPGLATFLISNDGDVELKTWQDDDSKRLGNIRHARQNGVPIIEWDQEAKKGIPGRLVGNWSLGNWSGSAQSEQRALRAAACLQEVNGHKYLIYGYFSSVTPNAMARVFQAYQCSYAIHLDMNALEHTYLALYPKSNKDGFDIQHLISGMDVLDRKTGDQVVPRFLGTADNRDFFYVMQR